MSFFVNQKARYQQYNQGSTGLISELIIWTKICGHPREVKTWPWTVCFGGSENSPVIPDFYELKTKMITAIKEHLIEHETTEHEDEHI